MRMFLATAAVALVLSQAAWAQPGAPCEYGMSVCESREAADLVFVGTVTRVTPATFSLKQHYAGYDQTAYVAVEQVYKGARRARVVLRQRGHAQKFIQSSRYLFYANHDHRARVWEVRPCGRTRMAQYAQDDLRFLGGLPAAAARSRVSGEVVHFIPPGEEEVEAPATPRLAGVAVRLSGGGRTYETKTGADGVYEFTGLPPGRYRVEVRAPNGLAFYAALHTGRDALGRARELEFELAAGGCVGLSVFFKTDRRVEPAEGGVGALGAAPPGPAA